MESHQRSFAATLILALGVLAFAGHADAQSVRVGIVATMAGGATVARVSLAQPVALRFKDEIFVQDKITTERDALVRILLGGKAIVTIRERSVVTITERPGASTIDVGFGRVAVSVVKSRMLPGEVIEVTTPNAAAAIRGTVIVAEVEPELHGVRSTITVLTGVIDVTRFDGVRVSGPVTTLGALQKVVIQGASPVGAPTGISREAGRRLGGEFTVPPARSPHATATPGQQAVIEASVGGGSGVSVGGGRGVSVGGGGAASVGGGGVSVGGGSAVSVGGGGAVSLGGGGGVSVGGGSGVSVGGGALGLGGGLLKVKKP